MVNRPPSISLPQPIQPNGVILNQPLPPLPSQPTPILAQQRPPSLQLQQPVNQQYFLTQPQYGVGQPISYIQPVIIQQQQQQQQQIQHQQPPVFIQPTLLPPTQPIQPIQPIIVGRVVSQGSQQPAISQQSIPPPQQQPIIQSQLPSYEISQENKKRNSLKTAPPEAVLPPPPPSYSNNINDENKTNDNQHHASNITTSQISSTHDIPPAPMKIEISYNYEDNDQSLPSAPSKLFNRDSFDSSSYAPLPTQSDTIPDIENSAEVCILSK